MSGPVNEGRPLADARRVTFQVAPEVGRFRPLSANKTHSFRARAAAMPYPSPVSPSGRFRGESKAEMRKRQRLDPHSPGGMYSPENMVTRERLVINKGKRPEHCTGKPNKLYNKHEVVGPIIDSMILMYYSMGWAVMPPEDDEDYGFSYVQPPPRSIDPAVHLHNFGYAPAPPTPAQPLCTHCGTFNHADFSLTADKSHMVCKCGVVSSAVHISQNREKNCAKEDDKTTRADQPYQATTDKFDHPARSCDEVRKEREYEAMGSRISKKAKDKLGIGWQQEHQAREAARAARQRQDMDPKDATKGQRIVIELEKLFTPLEPVGDAIKRFCRMEADRAWREAVRHSKVCSAKGMCQLRVKEKGPAIIADASLACSLQTLLAGDVVLDGVTHASVLVLADKLGALQTSKGVSCALRAVRTVVGALLSHHSSEPIESCPCTQSSCQASPAPSSSSDAASSVRATGNNTPFIRTDSSASDMAEGGEVIQLRDSISKVFRHLGTAMTNRVREGALRAIQDPQFRASLAAARADEESNLSRLPYEGLSYAVLEAVARATDAPGARSPRSVPPRILAGFSSDAVSLETCITDLATLLPSCMAIVPAAEGDCLFG